MSEQRPVHSPTAVGDTYEMLWDCEFCRTPKLLGLTHRHCPVCGAPQNAKGRYFPADTEKVAVANHQYVGRDRVCAHCDTFNSRSSQHCRDCGAPLDGAKDAHVRIESEARGLSGHSQAQPTSKAAPDRRSRVLLVFGLVLVTVLVSVCCFFFWKRDQTFQVVGHTWERTIDVERFAPIRQSTWCDQLPVSARELGRHKQVRSHEQVRDGETCSMRKVDQGDGTFREVKHCEPRYTSKPVYDYQCDYEANKWVKVRTLQRAGRSLLAPQWPQVTLPSACARVGCEREGARHEEYVVILQAPDGNNETCAVAQERWANFAVGGHYVAAVRVMGGGVDCGSLKLQ
jgi:hypothetical protein